MGMIKVMEAGSPRFSEPIAQLIKISSHGLRGLDRMAFEKRAGAEFAHKMADLHAADDEPLIHLLAVGTTEDYGPNRNGDGFRRLACARHHDSFVKHARWYRNHQNKDRSKSFGIIKLSTYHEPMKRVELIVGLNGSEKAAARNGGLVATRELEKLARDDEIAVSMACRVPFDICSGCGNRARTRAEYCTGINEGGLCKAGGLTNNIGTVLADGHMLHADNTEPTFFDISDVFRPADRIAYVSGLLKAAATASGVLSGAAWADALGLTVPYELLLEDPTISSQVVAHLKAAQDLAELEGGGFAGASGLGFTRQLSPQVEFPVEAREKLGNFLRALADEELLLPVADFLRLAGDMEPPQAEKLAAAVQRALPGIYGRMLERPEIVQELHQNPYVPAAAASGTMRMWALKHAGALSVRPAVVQGRARLAALRGLTSEPVCSGHEKTAAATPAVAMVAQEYALYKLAFVASISETKKDAALTRQLALLHNYVN